MINEKDKEGNLLPDELRHRRDVCPGLTGYAQAHGRNAVTWEERTDTIFWLMLSQRPTHVQNAVKLYRDMQLAEEAVREEVLRWN